MSVVEIKSGLATTGAGDQEPGGPPGQAQREPLEKRMVELRDPHRLWEAGPGG